MALNNMIDQIMATRVGDVPVGKGAMFAASRALTDGLIGLIKGYMPAIGGSLTPLLAAGGVSWAIKNIGGVRDFLGDNGSEVLAITSIESGLDTTIGIRDMVNKALSWVGVETTPMLSGPNLGARAGQFSPRIPLTPSTLPQLPFPSQAALPPIPRVQPSSVPQSTTRRALPFSSGGATSRPIPRPSLGQPHLTPEGPESQTGRKIRMNLVGR